MPTPLHKSGAVVLIILALLLLNNGNNSGLMCSKRIFFVIFLICSDNELIQEDKTYEDMWRSHFFQYQINHKYQKMGIKNLRN